MLQCYAEVVSVVALPLTSCPVCDKPYDQHWKVVNHIRKTKNIQHVKFLNKHEDEVVDLYLSDVKTSHRDYFKNLLLKRSNIFALLAYKNIISIVGSRINREELENIRKNRISATMSTLNKTSVHLKNISVSIKKAWQDGKFDNPEYLQAMREGYKKRRSYVGKNNPMYGIPSPRGAGRGKGGKRKDIGHYVRSTWEANFCRILLLLKRRYIYEPTCFYLKVDGLDCTYRPDFLITGRNVYYELKGHAASRFEWICPCDCCIKNRKRIRAMQLQHSIKVRLVGNREYKQMKKRFARNIKNWEK
jgi:hypothetical protein